jgi:hypothetical protein
MRESKKITFFWRCPKGHEPAFTYESEHLRSELDNGTLRYFCGMCGEFYWPSEEEKRNLKKRIEDVLIRSVE